jgi:DNA excision repair protein ERCC-4
MKFLVDHRETAVFDLVDKLCTSFEGVTCEIIQLPLGDFFIVTADTGILIERKSISDFFSSIRSNRLWDQLLRFMKKSELQGYTIKRKLLLLHGQFECEDPAQFWPQIMGAYMEVLFVYDIPIIIVEDNDAFFQCMRILIQREIQGKNDSLPQSRWFRKHCSPDLPEMDIRRYVLASIPSVGEFLAKNLLDHFGSIKAVANASEKQLQRIKGVGKIKAKKIYSVFH